MLKKWLCRRFNLVRAEDIPKPAPPLEPDAYWNDLLEWRKAKPVWPRIVTSETWQKDIEPWLKKLLCETTFMIMRADEIKTVTKLQERAMLLQELLLCPQGEVDKMERALAASYRKGGDEQFDEAMAQANRR